MYNELLMCFIEASGAGYVLLHFDNPDTSASRAAAAASAVSSSAPAASAPAPQAVLVPLSPAPAALLSRDRLSCPLLYPLLPTHTQTAVADPLRVHAAPDQVEAMARNGLPDLVS